MLLTVQYICFCSYDSFYDIKTTKQLCTIKKKTDLQKTQS